MQEAYTSGDDRTTLDRKAAQARARRARKTERRHALTVLEEMNVLKVQRAVRRAERSTTTTTKEGKVRRYRIGKNVADMCSWLLFWEGKGELSGQWVHKSAAEWGEEVGLTDSEIKTARRIAKEEGLWKEEEHFRPDDVQTVKYRLNLWRLLQVVNASEIENVDRRLWRARNNPAKKAVLQKELRKLEATRDDFGLIDGPDGPDEGTGALSDASEKDDRYGENGGEEDENSRARTRDPANLAGPPCQISRPPLLISPGYRGVPQSGTAGDSFSKDSYAESAEAVASPSPTPPARSSDQVDPDRFRGMKDAFAVGGRVSTIGDDLGRLMRGEGGRTGERVLGPMTVQCLAGDGGVTAERIAKTARGFFPALRREPLAYFVGAVEAVLEEVRVETVDAEGGR